MNKPATFAAPTSFKARFTTAEFARMCEADVFGDMKIELVDGELERMNPPMGAHSHWQSQTIALLWKAFGKRASGLVVGEVGIDLGDDTIVACDAAILVAPMAEHRWLLPQEVLLAVEVAQTTLARDLGFKRSGYAARGIPHYWVIDGRSRVIHVHAEPVNGDYAQIGTVRFGEPLAVPGTDQTIVID